MPMPVPLSASVAAAGHVGDLVRPRLRGVLHQYACIVAVATGCVLVALAETERARLAASVYAISLVALFGVSALYHRVAWRPNLRAWMKRLDHSMIFVFIAGTYTPFALLVLHGATALVVLTVVWAGAVLGVGSRLLWLRAPRFATLPLYVGLGWVAAFIVPQLIGGGGIAPFVLLCVGGVAYTVGGVMYALRRPNLAPRIFGYHELFHVMTLIAATCHYIAVSFAVYQVS
ncbi:MAG TPA: hemolysin III family protein [Mycobacteriales bacterium]|nr:hemolysin III family protein [Mycobacteriales bacterium]